MHKHIDTTTILLEAATEFHGWMKICVLLTLIPLIGK
jgi:hypothetical protein